MNYFILVISPMDQTFVGPFSSKELAAAAATEIPQRFDACVMDETERASNEAEFGACPLQSPDRI